MASYGFYSVLKTQKSTSVERSSVDVGIYSLISSLEITASRLKGTRLVPRKPARIFSSSKVAKNVVWKQAKKSGLVIWLIWDCMRFSTSLLYDCFNILKHPMLNG